MKYIYNINIYITRALDPKRSPCWAPRGASRPEKNESLRAKRKKGTSDR